MRTDSALLRTVNERRAMNELRRSGRLTRTELGERMRVAFPTVLRVVESLMAKGWVRDVGLGASNGGRRPQVLEINPGGAYALGVEVARDWARFAAVNLGSEIVAKDKVPMARLDDPSQLVRHLNTFVDNIGLPRSRCLGVGLAAPGPLDPERGLMPPVVELPHTWHGVPLVRMVEEALSVPARLSNDADAAALGEYWCGPHYGVPSLLFVLLDIGVGAGWVWNGSVYPGTHNAFGEIAHMVLAMPERLADIDQVHTLNVVSTPLIARAIAARRPVKEGETIADFVANARAGREPDRSVIARVLDVLAVGLSNLTDMLDPTRIVLGGATVTAAPDVLTALAERFLVLQPDRRDLLALAHYGDWAETVGAAAVVLQQVFDATLLVPA
jgi:N-acetylglucosamine repressor